MKTPHKLLSLLFITLLCATDVYADEREKFKLNSGAYGLRYELASFGWGASYRLNGELYHQFSVNYSQYKSTCLYKHFKGYGTTYTSFNDGNFSIDVHYYRALIRYSGHYLQPYWKIAPNFFRFEGGAGFNIKPAFGFRFAPMSDFPVGLELDVYYGYDVPVVGERNFAAGRHDFSAVVSLSMNFFDIIDWMHRNDDDHVDAIF